MRLDSAHCPRSEVGQQDHAASHDLFGAEVLGDSAEYGPAVEARIERKLEEAVSRLLEKSDLIVGQEFLPTDFDWRVGICDRRPLFVCRYHMASRHWQVIKRDEAGNTSGEGSVDTLSISEAPDEVIKTALKAANLIGDGLYGVDIKQVGQKCYVIEVNDNPNIDAGSEDQVLKDALYREIMGTFLKRIENRKRGLYT